MPLLGEVEEEWRDIERFPKANAHLVALCSALTAPYFLAQAFKKKITS